MEEKKHEEKGAERNGLEKRYGEKFHGNIRHREKAEREGKAEKGTMEKHWVVPFQYYFHGAFYRNTKNPLTEFLHLNAFSVKEKALFCAFSSAFKEAHFRLL